MRIIDADALMDYISRSINAMTEIGVAVDGEYLWGLINNGIDNAPTIELKVDKDYLIELIQGAVYDGEDCARLMKMVEQPKWIPVSERLPEADNTYLVYAPTYRGGSSTAKENYNGVMFSKYKNGKWSIEHGYYSRPNCVVAWMPLPDPWKGADDE